MSYTPSKHTTSNKPYGVQGIPDAARTYYYDDLDTYKYRPFVDTAEVLAYFDTPAKRMGHFSIIINSGGTLDEGVITGGLNHEYWFKDGVADENLVIKYGEGVVASFELLSGSPNDNIALASIFATMNAATQAAQDDIDAHAARTDNPHSATKAQVGLSDVDNTSDVNKPVSTAQATAIAVVQADVNAHEARTDNPHGVTKAQVGLSDADNTSDLNKPVSTAQAAAIAVVQSDVNAHEARTDNPHNVTKAQVGLGNADDTSDINKPISTAMQTALDLKLSILTAASTYEPIFAKNTAFNKNFGSSAGTVAEGNDSRIINGQTAFTWGNHAGLYSLLGHTHVTDDITNLSAYTGFDARYYTQTQVNNFFSGATVISGYNKTNWDTAYIYSQVGHIPLSQKGVALGVVPLNASVQIDPAYLPSYVDDVVNVVNYAALPGTGESGKIYVVEAAGTDPNDSQPFAANSQFRWTGSTYVKLVASPGTTDNVPEGSVNKYYTDARVQTYGDTRYVQLGGSYSNPSWITALAWTKITGVPYASASTDGVLSSADWNTFNNKVTSITGTANQITVTGTTTPVISLPATITGLTSVTSTSFVGALTGNASTATLAANSTLWNGVAYGGPYLPLTAGIGNTLSGVLHSSSTTPEKAKWNVATSSGGYHTFQANSTDKAYFQWAMNSTGNAFGDHVLISNATASGGIYMQTAGGNNAYFASNGTTALLGALTGTTGTFGVAKIGNSFIGSNYARFGHSSHDNASTYGFIQYSDGSNYVGGTLTLTHALTGTTATCTGTPGITLTNGDIKYDTNLGYGFLSQNNTRVLGVTNSGVNIPTLTVATATFSGTVTSTMAGSVNEIINATTTTSGYKFMRMFNGTSGILFGHENTTVGGNLMTGSLAGSAVISGIGAAALSFGVNQIVKYTIDASGNNSWTGSGTFGGHVYLNGPNHAYYYLNSTSTSYEAGIIFQNAGVGKWELFKGSSSNDFFLYNYNTASYAWNISSSTNAVTFYHLGGSGDRFVVANSNGTLYTATIGSGLSYSGGVLSATGGSVGTVTGTGTAGYLAKWTGSSSQGNSIASESGSVISVAGSVSSSGWYRNTTAAGMSGDYAINGTTDKVIWTIGSSWESVASMYGIGYSYNAYTDHCIVFRHNGSVTARVALSTGVFYGSGAGLTGTASSLTAGAIVNQANSATITASTGTTANTIVQRDASGYIWGVYANFSSGDGGATPVRLVGKNSGSSFYYDYTPANIQAFIGISSWALSGSKPSYSYSEISGRPTALSHLSNDLIYSWALASTKPSYVWTEIGSRPTALSSFTNDLGNYGGWITGYTEVDTLHSVTSRGASTTNAITVGSITATSGGFNSDIELKDILTRNLTSFYVGNQVSAFLFNWNNDPRNNGRDKSIARIGYGAQEILKLFPNAVYQIEDGSYAVDYTQVHTLLIDENTKRIQELEKEVADLKMRLN